MDKIDNYKPLQQDLDNIHKDSEGFVKLLKQQRFTFFSKVEDDYLKDPENETLQIFKNEKESIFDLENSTIQKRLVSENLTEKKQPKTIDDFIDTKNQKYKNIESLFCETSTMFSEDLHFAYDDEVNFLHIMLKLKGINVVNSQLSSKNQGEKESIEDKFNNDLIQIGCKVIPSTVTFTSENDYISAQ